MKMEKKRGSSGLGTSFANPPLDEALLDDDDELDLQTLAVRDIILHSDSREQLSKKEAATSKTSSSNQSGGDFLHEAGANNKEEIFGSEDGRESSDPDGDQASEKIKPTSSLFNYQSSMDKKGPRGKWSKQETKEFYKAVSLFGTDFSMMQLLFPEKTRNEVKLKYKKEERHHPLQLSDAINNCAKDLSYFKLVINRMQQTSTKTEQDAGRDALDFMLGEEVEDSTPGTNSFMDKKGPKGKWSRQDTEKFYKAVSMFGTDFSMMQLLFPEKTRHEVKLKYKKEERHHPLQLSDAINNCAEDLSYFKLVIERMQQTSTKAEQDAGRDALDFMLGEEVEDSTPRTNSFMDKKGPRERWSKQDTEKFYKAVSLLGTDFSMMQLLFPEKTRHEVKLKYKKEERHHPLQLSDAINNCAKGRGCNS